MKRETTDAKIGAAIRRCRKAAKMTQVALGEKIGVAYQQVQKYEAGTNRVSVSTFIEICEALGIPVARGIQTWLEPPAR